jgi:hypothetical protein
VPAVHRDDAERATPGRERPRARVRERRVEANGVVVHYTLNALRRLRIGDDGV